jgi:hypothetical protein
MVDWGKFSPLSRQLRLRPASTRRLVFIRLGVRDQVLVQRLDLGRMGDDMSSVLCSDFTLIPDNSKLSPVFTLSDMDFQDEPGSPVDSFVNQMSRLNGLQFPDTGIEVNLPVAVPWARLHVGQFATPFTIGGIDANGNVTSAYALNKPGYLLVRELLRGRPRDDSLRWWNEGASSQPAFLCLNTCGASSQVSPLHACPVGSDDSAARLAADPSRWTGRVFVPGADQHTLMVKARDASGRLSAPGSHRVVMITPADLCDLSRQTYLQDLLTFATEHKGRGRA